MRPERPVQRPERQGAAANAALKRNAKTLPFWRGKSDKSQEREGSALACKNAPFVVCPTHHAVVAVLVRQLRGPHFKTWPWCRRRSSMEPTAAVSPSNLPQSSTGRLEVNSVLARS